MLVLLLGSLVFVVLLLFFLAPFLSVRAIPQTCCNWLIPTTNVLQFAYFYHKCVKVSYVCDRFVIVYIYIYIYIYIHLL